MREDVYESGEGQRIRRITLEGEEGATPPIRLRFEDADTGDFLGRYENYGNWNRLAIGPMFER